MVWAPKVCPEAVPVAERPTPAGAAGPEHGTRSPPPRPRQADSIAN